MTTVFPCIAFKRFGTSFTTCGLRIVSVPSLEPTIADRQMFRQERGQSMDAHIEI